MSETIVQRKVAKLIQRELGAIIDRGQFYSQAMLTVSVVRVTRDLSIAKVYVSCFPEKHLPQAIETLEAESWQIRKSLGQRIRNKVRKIPEVRFYGDDTLQEAERIEELLDQIKRTEDTQEDPS